MRWPGRVAVAFVIAAWMLCGSFGYAALHENHVPGHLAQISQGATQLDDWQRTYAWAVWQALPRDAAPSLPNGWAYAAILADFGLIAAYSWLLGLCASWAFTEVAGRRNPQDKVSPLLLLGMAPMLAVCPDVVENILTILTLWTIPHGPWLSIPCGALMMLANLAKWIGAAGSVALIATGIVAKIKRPQSFSPEPAARV